MHLQQADKTCAEVRDLELTKQKTHARLRPPAGWWCFQLSIIFRSSVPFFTLSQVTESSQWAWLSHCPSDSASWLKTDQKCWWAHHCLQNKVSAPSQNTHGFPKLVQINLIGSIIHIILSPFIVSSHAQFPCLMPTGLQDSADVSFSKCLPWPPRRSCLAPFPPWITHHLPLPSFWPDYRPRGLHCWTNTQLWTSLWTKASVSFIDENENNVLLHCCWEESASHCVKLAFSTCLLLLCSVCMEERGSWLVSSSTSATQ